MGGDQVAPAVLDWLGAVHGVDDLRVVDASILPELHTTPTNVTVIMAAEHIAARNTAHYLKLRASRSERSAMSPSTRPGQD